MRRVLGDRTNTSEPNSSTLGRDPQKLADKGPSEIDTKESTEENIEDIPNADKTTAEQAPEEGLQSTLAEETKIEIEGVATSDRRPHTGSSERMASRRSVASVSEKGLEGTFSVTEIAGQEELNEAIDDEFKNVMDKWDSRKRGATLDSVSAVEEVQGTPFNRKPSWEELPKAETTPGVATDSVEPNETENSVSAEATEVTPQIRVPYCNAVLESVQLSENMELENASVVQPSEGKDLLEEQVVATAVEVSEHKDLEEEPGVTPIVQPSADKDLLEEPGVPPSAEASEHKDLSEEPSVTTTQEPCEDKDSLEEPAPSVVMPYGQVGESPTTAAINETPLAAVIDLDTQVRSLGEYVESMKDASSSELATLCESLSEDARQTLIGGLATLEAKPESADETTKEQTSSSDDQGSKEEPVLDEEKKLAQQAAEIAVAKAVEVALANRTSANSEVLRAPAEEAALSQSEASAESVAAATVTSDLSATEEVVPSQTEVPAESVAAATVTSDSFATVEVVPSQTEVSAESFAAASDSSATEEVVPSQSEVSLASGSLTLSPPTLPPQIFVMADFDDDTAEIAGQMQAAVSDINSRMSAIDQNLHEKVSMLAEQMDDMRYDRDVFKVQATMVEEALKEIVTSTTSLQATVDSAQEGLKSKLDTHEFASMKDSFNCEKAAVGQLQAAVSNIKSDLTTIVQNVHEKVGSEEFEQFKASIEQVSQALKEHKGTIQEQSETLETRLKALGDSADKHSKEIDVARADLAELSIAVAGCANDFEERMNYLERRTRQIGKSADKHEQDMKDHAKMLTAHEKDLKSHKDAYEKDLKSHKDAHEKNLKSHKATMETRLKYLKAEMQEEREAELARLKAETDAANAKAQADAEAMKKDQEEQARKRAAEAEQNKKAHEDEMGRLQAEAAKNAEEARVQAEEAKKSKEEVDKEIEEQKRLKQLADKEAKKKVIVGIVGIVGIALLIVVFFILKLYLSPSEQPDHHEIACLTKDAKDAVQAMTREHSREP